MFTGLIEDVGTVERLEPRGTGLRLTVRTSIDTAQIGIGDSVNIDGYCQTVVEKDASRFGVDVGRETIERTTASKLKSGDRVNLERAMRLGDRLGGHIVAGHVDGVGHVRRVERTADFIVFHVQAPAAVSRYLIEKGSVAMSGVSLTVNTVSADVFTVGIIPHTAARTTLRDLREGAAVNLEADLIGKYVEKFVLAGRGGSAPGTLTLETLAKNGFV